MEKILRKKIDAATGMPTSITRNDRLWKQILQVAKQWGEQNLVNEIDVSIISKKVVPSAFLFEQVKAGLGFRYSDQGGGLSAIVFDKLCGLNLAAARMSQSPNDMGEPSDVFLRLMNEGPAASFRIIMNEALRVEASAGHLLASVPENSEKSVRYLEVGLEISCNDSLCRAQLYFDCDDLIRQLATLAEVQNQSAGPARSGLRASIQNSKLCINAVLEHVQTNVGACARMELGDVISLTDSDMGKVAMSVKTLSGLVEIASGEVGVWHQNRAVRLSAPISREFLKDLANT